MRLPKHSLPKAKPVKCLQTVKHKKSEKKLAKLAKKAAKADEMEMESMDGSINTAKYASEEEREAARLERKKANAHRILYKKNIKHMTGRNGPRAING